MGNFKNKQNKTNSNRNNLKNHKTSVKIHNMNKDDFEELYKQSINEIQDLLLNENKFYESAGEVDLNFYLDWIYHE